MAPRKTTKTQKTKVLKEEQVVEEEKKISKNDSKKATRGTRAKKIVDENSVETKKTTRKRKNDNVEQTLEEPEEKVLRSSRSRTKKTEVTEEKSTRTKKTESAKTAAKKTKLVAKKSEPETKKLKPETKKSKSETKDSKSETKNSKSETKNSKPENEKPLKNKTNNDFESIDYSCSRLNQLGKEWNIKIATWNVDGIRAWFNKGCLDYLTYEKPDIFCIQETKCSLEKLPNEIREYKGYHIYWFSADKEGYAGVGLLTKKMPLHVINGIEDEEHDSEGRVITAEYEKFYLCCVYVPNSGRGLVTMPKRLDWNEKFKKFINNLNSKKPVIICGDMNVAHQEIDLKNPKTNKKTAGFTQQERDGMTDFLSNGYVDIFRTLYPDKEGAYTFWTYMANSRAKNVGWRVDYFLLSERITPNVCDTVIRSEVYGSDHCPLVLYLNI